MATLLNRKNGTRAIQFLDAAGSRKTISLGKASKSQASAVKTHIEHLLSAELTDQPVPRHTAIWLSEVSPTFKERLAAVGLIELADEQRQQSTLAEFVDDWITGRTDVKPASRLVYGRCRKWLVDYFGDDQQVGEITEGDADEWRLYIKQHLAENTARKMASVAKQIFRHAVRKRIIKVNPFNDLPAAVRQNFERDYFVTREEINKVIDAAPDAEWRLILALSRYGGLRTPSEIYALRWDDIDWPENRFTVRSSKTEHHEGKASRIVPLFPELRPYLDNAHEIAGDNADYVISTHRLGSGNLRTQAMKLLQRAGLEIWPKLFHNMRASRQTELENDFPTHVVCAWLGNSPAVAHKHYLKVTEDHMQRAAYALQNMAEMGMQGDARPKLANDINPLPAKRNNPLQQYATDVQWTILDSNQ